MFPRYSSLSTQGRGSPNSIMLVILFSSEQGIRPRDIPRKTHAMPSSDEKSNILFNVSFSKSGCGGEGGGGIKNALHG